MDVVVGSCLTEERLADLAAQKAAAGGEHDELRQGVQQIHLALVAPLGKEILSLLAGFVLVHSSLHIPSS